MTLRGKFRAKKYKITGQWKKNFTLRNFIICTSRMCIEGSDGET
jgi:hypothetical protein